MTESMYNPNGGPCTPAGRAISSKNSTKHGLTGKQIVMPDEDPEEFEALRSALEEEHQPATTTEALLVHDLAKFHWLKERAIRLQDKAFLDDGSIDQKHLALMIRYQNSNQNAFFKTLKTLQTAQKERRKQDSKFVSQIVPPSGFDHPDYDPNPRASASATPNPRRITTKTA